jgi:adenylate cyclase
MLARFEATTGDVIAAAGANVAKRIGDAVMFVTNGPASRARSHRVIEAARGSGSPSCASGSRSVDVIVRQGDFYGRTVNLAARLVAEAEPGTALADAALHNRSHGRRGLRLRSRGEVQPPASKDRRAVQLLR